MDDRSAQLRASALSSCGKRSLRKFSIDCHDSEIDDESAAELVDIMASWRNLKHLSLCFWIDGIKWCGALATLLQNPHSKLKELDLDNFDTDIEGAVALRT